MSCWFALLSRDHVCASCFAPTPKSREVLQRRVEELRRRGQLVPRRDFLPRCGWRGPSLPQTSNRFLFDFLCEVSLLKFNCQQKRVHFFPHGNPRDVHCSQSFAVAILCFRPKGPSCLNGYPRQHGTLDSLSGLDSESGAMLVGKATFCRSGHGCGKVGFRLPCPVLPSESS